MRMDVADGWYHITARGINREAIFLKDGDREHFMGLLATLPERFRIAVYAYVLMDNHYHLLIRTPEANASQGIQWLNVSYSVWWNRRHGRVGPVFQGRFKSILVEGGGWILRLSQYLHLNPVAVSALGLGKGRKKAERLGWAKPRPEEARRRLEILRGYRWSSYRAYAAYEKMPDWLETKELVGHVKGGRAGYREQTERQIGQGVEESIWEGVRWGMVLGSERYAEQVRGLLAPTRESRGRRMLRVRRSWAEVVEAVERRRGEKWEAFRDRHGDWGRDLVIYVARRECGMTLRELGERAGGMDYTAVSMAGKRLERRLKDDAALRRHASALLKCEM